MSALAIHTPALAPPRVALAWLAGQRRLILCFAFGFPVFFYLLLLSVLIIRYCHLPNYVTPYNWPANVWRIIESTGSVADMLPIIGNEWLLEIGYKNYLTGYGVADWSLSLVPHKLVMLALTGALIGLNVALLVSRPVGDALGQSLRAAVAGLLTSAGAAAAAMTSATVFSASHCAFPSWVGGLAIIGFDSYDVFSIEPYGSAIFASGVVLFAISALLIAAPFSIHREVRPC